MPKRLATLVALLAFALCLIVGTFEAGNPFTTTVGRALVAMAATYAVGLVVGTMGRKAIDENLAAAAATTTTPAVEPGKVATPPGR